MKGKGFCSDIVTTGGLQKAVVTKGRGSKNGRHAITRGNFRVLRGAPTTKMAHQMLSLGLGNLEAYISGESGDGKEEKADLYV